MEHANRTAQMNADQASLNAVESSKDHNFRKFTFPVYPPSPTLETSCTAYGKRSMVK